MPNNVERTIPFEEVDDMPDDVRAGIRHRLFRKPDGRDYMMLTESAADKFKQVSAVLPDVLKQALPGGVSVDDMDGLTVRIMTASAKGRVYLQIGLVIE